MTRICPICDARYDEGVTFCPLDGGELQAPGQNHPGSLIGKTIADRYEVLEQIATGGMGVVYKARQKMLERYVALKVLPRELAANPDTERRFFNEARTISQLRHPHIVTLFDFGRTADRRMFIAMEYVQGEPLGDHIDRGPLPTESAVQIADQVCSALAEAHRAGIVHRDIKPDNVMLEVRSGRLHVRLLDFGIAKSELDADRLTRTGIVFGTPEYISPEQVIGEPVDTRADLYAVGLLLFEMLAGERPYPGSGTSIAYKHAHDPVPSVRARRPEADIPMALDRLVYRLMSKSPTDRPATADEVRALLTDAVLLPPAPPASEDDFDWFEFGAPPSVAAPMPQSSAPPRALPPSPPIPDAPRQTSPRGHPEVPRPTSPRGHPEVPRPTSPRDQPAARVSPPTLRGVPPERPPPPPPPAAGLPGSATAPATRVVVVDSAPPPGPPPVASAPPVAEAPQPPVHEAEAPRRPTEPPPSVEHPLPTLAPPPPEPPAPATLVAPPPVASKRPLMLGGILALVGLTSLAASFMLDRPANDRRSARALPPKPAIAAPAAPALAPLAPHLLRALHGPLEAAPVPPSLRAEVDPYRLPVAAALLEGDEPTEADAAELRRRISTARHSLGALREGDPARRPLLTRIGNLEWQVANARYAEELERYDRESAAYVNGEADTAPVAPVPAYGNAVIEYEQLLREAPDLPHADTLRFYIGHGLMMAGRGRDAAVYFERLLAEHPDSEYAARVHLPLAEQALTAGDAERALPHLMAAALSDDPRTRRYVRFLQAHAAYALGAWDDAIEAFQQVLEALGDDPVARAFFRQQAIDGLTLAFAHQPDGRRHAANYLRGLGGAALVEQQNHLLARALAELGQPGEAAAVFAAMIEAPTHPPTSALEAELRVRLAAARLDAGEPGTALSVLDEGLAGCTSPRLDAQAAFCSVTRGRALDALKRPDEAEVALHQAADIDPVAAEALPAVAEARFLLAERQFAALDAAHADLTAMRTEFDALDAAYARVSALDDPRWRVAATYRRGVLQQALADRLRADPKRAAEASRAGQVALEHFGAAVRLARAHDVRTPWSRAADEQVSRLGESPN